jgi:hypothetical protein
LTIPTEPQEEYFTPDILLSKLKLQESRPYKIWALIEQHFGTDFLKNPAQSHYGITYQNLDNLFEDQQK